MESTTSGKGGKGGKGKGKTEEGKGYLPEEVEEEGGKGGKGKEGKGKEGKGKGKKGKNKDKKGKSKGPDPTSVYTFATVGGQPLELAFWAPTTPGPAPAPLIIWIHGGGWRGGGWNSVQCFPFLDKGFAIASLQYRLTSETDDWGGEPVIWPAQAHDVKAGVRWLRGNASMLNVDPDTFISFGQSAGGHLSAILATTHGVEYLEGNVGDCTSNSSKVALSVDYYGPSSFLDLNADQAAVGAPLYPEGAQDCGADNPASTLFGAYVTNISITEIVAHSGETEGEWAARTRLAKMASPAWFAAGNEGAAFPPPILICHGDEDAHVPLTQSTRLHQELVKRGANVTLEVVPGASHGDMGGCWPGDEMLEKVHTWIQKQLAA